ncbi:MAG: hypothetical protein H6728_15670 [Myxococcales bacterium]|nr:hypothetical protein [Myxococcales bacterium]
MREWLEGKRVAQRMIKLYPKDADLLFWAGQFEEGNKSDLLAFQLFTKTLELSPKHTAAFFGQLRTAYKRNQLELVETLKAKIPSIRSKA